MNIQIQDLDKAPLDWAVASLLGVPVHVELGSVYLPQPSGISRRRFSPTSDWETLGPLLAQHQVFFRPVTVTTRTGLRIEMIEAYVRPVFSFQNYVSRNAPEVIGRGHNHQWQPAGASAHCTRGPASTCLSKSWCTSAPTAGSWPRASAAPLCEEAPAGTLTTQAATQALVRRS